MTYTTIVAREVLAQHLDDPAWVIFDCRFDLADLDAGERAYGASHIPNARHAHLERDLSGTKRPSTGRHPLPEPYVLSRKLGEWGVNKAKQVVAYDDAGGAMAARLWWLVRWLGHDAVAVLDGGFERWREEGRPVTPEPPRIEATSFAPQPRTQAWVNTAFVESTLNNKGHVLVDARARPRFSGAEEPIDPVAGHIPGALNRPFTMNLDASGEFLPPEQLNKAFGKLLRNATPTRVVHMCGSGVTACHNLLAMEIAGLAGSHLYAGSWSEWITDSDRPRETDTA